jgi:ethanolamine ammonia-lyase small subunit
MKPVNFLPQNNQASDEWRALRLLTAARIALGRTGVSIPLQENLAFRLSHAHARDAVFSLLQVADLVNQLKFFEWRTLQLQSKCVNRVEYLQRPDLGRQLDDASRQLLQKQPAGSFDVAILLADGLSATAINQHAIPVLSLLIPLLKKHSLSVAPLSIIQNGRVAIADEAGQLLHAAVSIILIGERPGLSSPDSMSAYITWQPAVGLTDERRNCISNIRPQGLGYAPAAEKIIYLVQQVMRLQISGVQLKDNAITNGDYSP